MTDAPERKPQNARVTLWLPADLVEEAKIGAIRKKMSLSRWVTRLLRQALEAERQS